MLNITWILALLNASIPLQAVSEQKLEMKCEQTFRFELSQLQAEVRWQNGVNTPFFEAMSKAEFLERSCLCGMDSLLDLDLIHKTLASVIGTVPRERAVVFEVGGGYGRIAVEMRRRFPSIELYIFEHTPRYAALLKSTFEHDQRTKVVPRSILHRTLYKSGRMVKADIILLMWSTLLEFSPAEMVILMKRLKSSLTPEGVIVIDLPSAFSAYSKGHIESEDKVFGQEISHEINNHHWKGYMPSPELFDFLVLSNQLTSTLIVDYVPWSNHTKSFSSERSLYILKKK